MRSAGLLLATALVSPFALAEGYDWSSERHACLITDTSVTIYPAGASTSTEHGPWANAPKTVFLGITASKDDTRLFPESVTASEIGDGTASFQFDNAIFYEDGYEFSVYHDYRGHTIVLDTNGKLSFSQYSRTGESPKSRAWFTFSADCTEL